MKLAGLFLVLTFLTQGHGQVGRRRGTADLEAEVLKKIQGLEVVLQKIKGRVFLMNQNQLELNSQKLEDALDVMTPRRAGSGGQYETELTVSGSIENHPFAFQVVDTMDLANKCYAHFTTIRMSFIDNIAVSTDFSTEQRQQKSSGYWQLGEACGIIASIALDQGLPAPRAFGFQAIGTIENETFQFSGAGLSDILNQCTSFVQKSNISFMDNFWVFNGAVIGSKRKAQGYWRTSTEVCNLIIQEIK
jgi:hypothetical protein